MIQENNNNQKMEIREKARIIAEIFDFYLNDIQRIKKEQRAIIEGYLKKLEDKKIQDIYHSLK